MNEIEKALNLVPMKRPDYIKELEEEANLDSAIKDFESARGNIVHIIDIGTKAVDELYTLAQSGASIPHYEILSTLMKNMAETSTKLMQTHEAMEKLTNKKQSKNIKNEYHQHNNLMVSTSDIQKAIAAMDKKNNE